MLIMKLLYPLLALLLHAVSGQNLDSALSYLTKYGYLSTPSPVAGGGVAHDDSGVQEVQADTQETLQLAVSQFQRFAGLEQTGELNERTVELMSSPRCGVRDVVVENETLWRRGQDEPQDDPTLAKYQLYGTRWPRSRWDLTYRIIKYSRVIDRVSTDVAFKEAFSMWEKVSNLKFSGRRSGEVDITISFDTYSHGDNSPFDGLGQTLAHAYFPTIGEIHMDDSEQWTVNSYSGTSLLWVAVHEIGHSLGLRHSEVKSAIMTPFYQGYDPNKQLHQDDINGIQAMYGKKKGVHKPTTVRPSNCPLINMNTRNRFGVSYVNEVASWEQCSSSCRSRCQHWTWHHERAGKYANLCVLMEDYEETASDTNAISGSRGCYKGSTGRTTTTTATPLPSLCTSYGVNTKNREGVTYWNEVPSWQRCAEFCKEGCNHWTWYNQEAGENVKLCVLMKSFVNSVADSTAVSGSNRFCPDSGHTTPAPPSCIQENTNTRDRELSTRYNDVTSWRACADICKRIPDCLFWTWHHEDAGVYALRCFVMAGFGQKVEDGNAVTGDRGCDEERVCIEEDTNTRERQLSTRIDDVSSWKDCAALCRKKSDCSFWTWHHAEAGVYALRCLIMAGFGQKVEDILSVTGDRDCY